MKAGFLYLCFLLLTFYVSAQEYKKIIPITISIMERLQIKIRNSYNENSILPKILVDDDQIGYSAEFNLDITNPIISMSTNTYLLCTSPKEYYSNFRITEIPKEIIFIDSLRHISSLIHEISHFLEDTTMYNLKTLYPSAHCRSGEVFCFVRYPAEFNAYAVGAAFVLSNINNNKFNEIMKMQKSIKEKKVEVINQVYYYIYKYPDFIRPLIVTDLL